MESLNLGFWEFFPVYSVFFAEREMNSDFPFMEIDICQGSGGRDRGIESESELTHHDLTLILHDQIIESRKERREVR
jgi:hypothetical protein